MINWKTFPEVPFRVKCSDANNGINEGSEYTVIRVEEDNRDKDFYLFYLEEVAEAGYFAYRFDLVEGEGNPVPEETLVVNDQGGVKADSGKLEWTLLPWRSLKEVVEVLMYGNRKYPCPSNANWKKVEPERYKKALMRHVVAWLDGEKVDEETGKSHLAHAGCCILFLLWFEVTGKLDE